MLNNENSEFKAETGALCHSQYQWYKHDSGPFLHTQVTYVCSEFIEFYPGEALIIDSQHVLTILLSEVIILSLVVVETVMIGGISPTND